MEFSFVRLLRDFRVDRVCLILVSDVVLLFLL